MSNFPLNPAPDNRLQGGVDPPGDNNLNAKAISAIIAYLGDPAGLADGQLLTYDAVNNKLVPVSRSAHDHAAASAGVYLTADQSLSHATYTSLLFDGETFDTGAFHDNATNPERFTVPAGMGGKYLLTGTVSFASDSTGLRIARWLANGGAQAYGSLTPFTGASNRLSVSTVVALSAGDYVELQGYQSSGGPLAAKSNGAESQAAIYYLGA